MVTAFILINTEIGAENQVVKTLREIDGVEEVHGLWGVYDLIVNIKAHDMDELKEITKRIGDISQINSKLTMIVSKHSALSLMNKKSSEIIRKFGEEPLPILV